MEYKIALIPGDGIGPEIVSEAKRFLIKYVKNIIIHLLIQRCSSVELLSTFTVSRSQMRQLPLQKLQMQF